jgi:integrase
VNHHRTIVNGIFNFSVKRGRFDRNPVAAVRQRPEPPGRDRIVSPAEFRALWDKAKDDREMRAFLALAGTTTMRKGEILSLRWDRVHLEDAPYATLVRTKTGHQRHVPIPQSIVKTLKALPSCGAKTICSLHIRPRDARNRSDLIAGTSASSFAHLRKRPT